MTRLALRVKSPAEIAVIREGGGRLRRALEEVVSAVRPGVTGKELDARAEEALLQLGAEPSFKGYAGSEGRTFPTALCVSVNRAIVHGVPTEVPLRTGDVVKLDLGCRYRGLFADTARTVIVGEGTPEARRLADVTRRALDAAIAEVRPGGVIGDLGAVVQEIIEGSGYAVVRDLTGHGVGYAVHEEPRVPNVGTRGKGLRLVPGLVLAIEPMVIAGRNPAVEVLPDGWTVQAVEDVLTAHEEHTVAVTDDGVRILTA